MESALASPARTRFMIANCPKCHESVLLPTGVTADSRVRCPLCQDEYLLAEALRQLPPALIVVELVPSGVASGGDEYALAAPETGFGELATHGDAAAASGYASPEMATRPVGVRKTTRPKRPPKNPAVEGIKIVLGGVVGLFMAQMILWWLPGTWRRDPFGWGPTLGNHQLTRMLVPKDFWPKTDAAGTTDDAPGGSQNAPAGKKAGGSATASPPRRPGGAKVEAAGEIPSDLFNDDPMTPAVKRQLDLLNDLPDDPLDAPEKPAAPPTPEKKSSVPSTDASPVNPAEEPPPKPAEKPAGTPAEKPEEKPVEKPGDAPPGPPSEKPEAEKPAAPASPELN